MPNYEHIPVLLNEVVSLLDPKPGENFIDATLGGGGYSFEIINKIKPDGKLLAIDLDEDAIENLKSKTQNLKSITLVHSNFAQIDKIVKNHGFPPPNGIVADIGLSSYQLDQSGRGISFQKKEILDMRFDHKGTAIDAKYILNEYEEKELLRIFREFGEEKFSSQIIRKIIDYRLKIKEIHYTDELYGIIQDALPKPVKHKADDSARRIFQALRIEVNHELSNLEEFLPKAFDLLAPGGRMAVVTFHSLEDRIVKQFFAGLTKGCVCPIDFPQCICGKNPQGRLLNKKIIIAGEKEIKNNPRSKPAKLRGIIKI